MEWPAYEPDPLHVKLKFFEKHVFSGSGEPLFVDWLEWGKQYLDQTDLLHQSQMNDQADPPEGNVGDDEMKAKTKRYRASNRKKVAFWWTNQLKVGCEALTIAKRYKNQPKAMIEALETRYDPKSETLLERLKDEKRFFKMRPNEKVDATNKRLEELCQKLSDQGKDVSDEKKRDLLVRALKNAEWDEHLRDARGKIKDNAHITHTVIYKILPHRIVFL